jgi:hypothetical protein
MLEDPLSGERGLPSGRIDSTLRTRALEHVLEHGDSLKFTDCFWKNCEPHRREVARYPSYVKVLQMSARGEGAEAISRGTRVKLSSVRRWVGFEQRPKLAH